MKLSILIPSYNMAGKIDQCLHTIFDTDADKDEYEVVVCDSSADGSMDVYRKWVKRHSNLKVMHCGHRLAIGPARNLAWQKCVGEYVLCLDVDDKLASHDTLKRVLEGLDGKDIYFCPYKSRRDSKDVMLAPKDTASLAAAPVAAWTKVYRRELYVAFPGYMPEDVWPHFLLVDKCKTVGSFGFAVVDYDNTPENKGAISRTFDWLSTHPCNLLQLADSGEL